jgi:Cu2+-exporting ATPase
MTRHLVWAEGDNIVSLPLVAVVLYKRNVVTSAAGVLLKSLSTIIVAINASLLKVK